jgi:hypothetical protein
MKPLFRKGAYCRPRQAHAAATISGPEVPTGLLRFKLSTEALGASEKAPRWPGILTMHTGPAAAVASLLTALSLIPPAANAGGPRTVAGVIASLTPRLRPNLHERFRAAGAAYPPAQLTLVAYKHERRLEVWAPADGRQVRVHEYPILAASGEGGPKLREGDFQVPEGVYRLSRLNPNSRYHLSIRVDYPNARDRQWAARDGRTRLGGDIFIHGKAVSRGCLAIGDEAIEELFTLLAEAGLESGRIIIAPNRALRDLPVEPAWVAELYEDLRRALEAFGSV